MSLDSQESNSQSDLDIDYEPFSDEPSLDQRLYNISEHLLETIIRLNNKVDKLLEKVRFLKKNCNNEEKASQ